MQTSARLPSAWAEDSSANHMRPCQTSCQRYPLEIDRIRYHEAFRAGTACFDVERSDLAPPPRAARDIGGSCGTSDRYSRPDVRSLAASSDLAHPDLDGEHSVRRDQPRNPPLAISKVRAYSHCPMLPRLHPDERFLDARNRFPLPEHGVVVDENTTALAPEQVQWQAPVRLSFV